MAFERKYFADGESTFRVPKWRKDIEKINAGIDTFSYQEETERRNTIKENEVGIKHPTNGSYITIRDDGTIEAFTGYGTGMRISKDESIQFFANKFSFIGNDMEFISRPNAIHANGKPVNSEYPVFQKKGLSKSFLEEAKSLDIKTYGLEEIK